jgi:hypothetical protein
MKRANVHHVLTNNFILFYFLFLVTNPSLAKNYGHKLGRSIEDVKNFIAFDDYTKATCALVESRRLVNGYSYIDPSFDAIINQVKIFLNNPKDNSIQHLFHPRLGITKGNLLALAIRHKEIFGAPFEISAGQMLSLLTPDNRSQLIGCDKVDKSFYSLYGYEIQFVVRLDIVGKKELGEVYFILVPKGNILLIGAFIIIKKTHVEKDYSKWFNDGMLTYQRGNMLMSYLKFDIAKKMLSVGKPIFSYNDLEKVTSTQNQVMSSYKWKKEIAELIPKYKVAKTASVFTDNGVGLLIRIRINKEASPQELRNKCRHVIAQFRKNKSLSSIDGIRCGLVVAGEGAQEDGVLGSRFFR